jgi:hypothetical protein
LRSSDRTLAAATALSTLSSTLPLLDLVGFQAIVYEDFYEELASLIQRTIQPDENGKFLTTDTLLQSFQDPSGTCALVPCDVDAHV